MATHDGQVDTESVVGKLQDKVTQLSQGMMMLTSRLEESNHLKLGYRERLMELTGEQFEEDDSFNAEEAPENFQNWQALQRENRQLSQALEAERACARQRDLEASKPAWMLSPADIEDG